MKNLILGIILCVLAMGFIFLLSYVDSLDYKVWYKMGGFLFSVFGAVIFGAVGVYCLINYFSDE